MTFAEALAEVEGLYGVEHTRVLRRAVAAVADLPTETLRTLGGAARDGVLPAILGGLAPAGSVAEQVEKVALLLGPEKAPLVFILADLGKRLDLAGLQTVLAVAEKELARQRAPAAELPN